MASRFVSSILSVTSNLVSLVRSSPWTSSSSSNPPVTILQDLKDLESMLKSIRAAMHDAEKREIREESVKLWLTELKDVACDAEDVLDEFQFEVLRAHVEGRAAVEEALRHSKRAKMDADDKVSISTSDASNLPRVSIPSGMADRIKKIRDTFDEISRDREALSLKEEYGKRRFDGTIKCLPPTTHLVNELEVYGRESDKEMVIEHLFSDSSSKFSVIAVVGKGGLGKTTLAQLVYNDEWISKYFDQKIWICVSEDFDVVRMTKSMIEYNTMRECAFTELDLLQDTLKEMVKGKRLLLVLDDVWNEQKSLWEKLKEPLAVANTVRVLVTTRNESVAMTKQTMCSYHLGYLPHEHCWQLFQHHAFYGQGLNVSPNLVEIGKKIVKKCDGLPLAVKSLGGLLQHETDEDSWNDVLQSELWELDEKNEILPALRLSYNRMPTYLKPCFLYCSMFPKDYEFRKDRLVRLWMAQGFIQPRGGREVEDIGHEYFVELQRRSFFDCMEESPNGLDVFKMHDNIHDLARHISGNECRSVVNSKPYEDWHEVRHLYVESYEKSIECLLDQNLGSLRTLSLEGYAPDSLKMTSIGSLLRRLRALHLHLLDCNALPDSIGSLKHLRYLCVNSKHVERLNKSACHLFNLQVLDLHCNELEELPREIGTLVHLRHLSIQSLYIASLPESISQLYNLQTLDLMWCASLHKIPSSIRNLHNLRHLDLRFSGIESLPAGIWKLTKMETLACELNVRREDMHHGIGELKELINLGGHLSITGLTNILNVEEAKEANLKSKHQLKHLYLVWNCVLDVGVEEYFRGGLNLNVHSKGNKNILVDKEMKSAVLESLQPHTNLMELHIYGYDGVRYPTWVNNPFFTNLTTIKLSGCGNENLICLPTFGEISSLKNLTLARISHVNSIGNEFCRCISSVDIATQLNKVAFPSLRELIFEEMPQWQEWYGVLDGDFPQIKELRIKKCQKLRLLPTLPSKLVIVHFEECLQLSLVLGLHSLYSLKKLSLINCPDLQFPSNISLPSNFKQLYIQHCPKLSFLLGLHNLNSLEELDLRSCPQLQLPSNYLLPSKLRIFHIRDYLKPIFLSGLNCLNSLEELDISCCPELQLPTDNLLPSKLKILHIKGYLNPNFLIGLHKLNFLEELHISDCPELQLSSEEFLPLNLKTVKIKNCIKLTSMLRFQNATSLAYLEIVGCPLLQLLPDEKLPLKLEELCIEDCHRLKSLVGLQYLDSLRILRICYCPELQLLKNDSLPTQIQTLYIIDCPQFTLLLGLQNLTSLKRLHLARCQQLQLPSDVPLLSVPDHLEIVDCPSLREWCSKHEYSYKKELSKLIRLDVSSISEIISLYEMRKLSFIKHLCIEDVIILHRQICQLLPSTLQILELVSCDFMNSYCLHLPQGLNLLQELRIQSCEDLYVVVGLHYLTSLQNLIIRDCPEVYVLGELLPPMIKSFIVHDCSNLISLPLLHQNMSSLKELHIENCDNLASVAGLNNITSIQSLRIHRCPKLHLSSDENLSSSPEYFDVSQCPGLKDWCQTNQILNTQKVHHSINEVEFEKTTDDDDEEGEAKDLEMADAESDSDLSNNEESFKFFNPMDDGSSEERD